MVRVAGVTLNNGIVWECRLQIIHPFRHEINIFKT